MKTVTLPARLRRFRKFNGLRLGTTGLPLALAAEIGKKNLAGDSFALQAWIAEVFVPAANGCVFVVPEDSDPESPDGLPGLDLSAADTETVGEVFAWVCGAESASAPLPSSGATSPESSASPVSPDYDPTR